jgi:hypothetical protein
MHHGKPHQDAGGAERPAQAIEMQGRYDEDYLTLLVRDPYWAFAYWEICDATLKVIENKLKEEFSKARLIIKVYKAKTIEELEINPQFYMAIDVTHATSNCWYINLELPDHAFVAKLGYMTLKGAWTEVAVSNVIQSPRDEIAMEEEQGWQSQYELYEKFIDEKFISTKREEAVSSPELFESRGVEG